MDTTLRLDTAIGYLLLITCSLLSNHFCFIHAENDGTTTEKDLVDKPLSHSACGDWIQYKDEECIHLVSLTGSQTKEDADMLCESFDAGDDPENVPKLVKIKTKEKQEFMEEMLFSRQATFDNVWLGLEMGNDSAFRWNDGTEVLFSNWEEMNAADNDRRCVQMESGEGTHKTGAWLRANCKRSNAVVCERTQTWSVSKLQNILLSFKLEVARNKQLLEAAFVANRQETKKKINKIKAKAALKIKALRREADTKIKTIEKILNEVKQDSKNKIQEAVEKISAMSGAAEENIKILMQSTVGNTSDVKNEERKNIYDARNSVPIGFIYIQLPDQSPPVALWPTTTWIDVSAAYAGLFFRVTGGNASSFGEIQEENVSRITNVEAKNVYGGGGVSKNRISIPAHGEWSEDLFTGSWYTPNYMFIRFLSEKGEVRPRNKAVIIWKRTS